MSKCPMCAHCAEPSTADNPSGMAMEMIAGQLGPVLEGDAGAERARAWLDSEILFVVGSLGVDVRNRGDV